MRVRASWLIVFLATVLTLALPSVRQVAKTALSVSTYLPLEYGSKGIESWDEDNFPRFFGPYRARAVEWVRREAPADPELLLGAALLAYDKEAARDLLRQAAERANSGPTWAAYVDLLIGELPPYESLAESGVDPADPTRVAENLKELRQKGVPEGLPPQDVAPALHAVRAWEEADPKNALPFALEARLLHAAGQSRESLTAWEKAARLPRVTTCTRAHGSAKARLLVRMGMAEPVALRSLILGADGINHSYSQLRSMARIAQHEGLLARMQGRNAEAIRWWRATSDFGLHMRTSAEVDMDYLVGVAIEGIGISQTWRWYPNRATGYWSGPLMNGAIWYGPYHDFYVRQVGVAEDTALRDRLVLGKVRSQMFRDNHAGMHTAWQAVWSSQSFKFATLCLLSVFIYLVLYLSFASWGSHQTESATTMAPRTFLALTAVAAAPFTLAALYALHSTAEHADLRLPLQALTEGFVVSLAAAVFLPLLVAPSTRVRGFGLTTTWRGNLRRLLPPLVAVPLLLFLGFAFEASRGGSWMDQWLRRAPSQFAVYARVVGLARKKPPIPAGAWRAQYPVLQTPSGPNRTP